MRIAIFDPSFPGFPRELARGEAEQGSDKITGLKATEGRGLSYGRRLSVVALEGNHIGRTVVLEMRGEEGDTLTLAEPWPLSK